MSHRLASAALGLSFLAGSVGCKYLPSRTRSDAPPPAVTGAPAAGLLVGPQSGDANHLELSPKDALVAWLRTAHEMEKGNQPEAAIELYEKARAADPKPRPDISRRLAVLYDRTEEFGKAQAEYDLVLKANPADPELLADLGYSYYCRGDWKRAEETLRQAVAKQADHKRAWMNLGLTLCAAGRFEDGYAAFLKSGTEAEARVNLAFAFSVQGKTADARDQYQQALRLEPGMKTARTALAALENPRPARKKPVRLADDLPPEHQVPTVQELEQRIRDTEAKTTPPRDLPPVELRGPAR